jgi:peptidyl-prolyl cis-trans isomerase A (cyclophilin A)
VKIAIAAVLSVVIGLGAVIGVYQFRETRMTPADLDEMRLAERRLAEAEEASEDLELTITEEAPTETDPPATEEAPPETSTPEPIAVAQVEEEVPVIREWKQIDQPGFSKTKPFFVKFDCSMGDFVVEFHPEWSPNGAQRIHELIGIKFLDDCRFFRVIQGFMAQFGISGDPALAAKWDRKNINDDAVKQSNKRGYLSFAMRGPNTRSTQLFINFGDNSNLDSMGFSPIGEVVEGMDIVDEIYNGYGGGPDEGGRGPRQDLMQSGGTKYLNEYFPKLDYIKKARFVEPVEAEAGDESDAEAA